MLPPAGNSDGTAGHSDEVSASLPVAGVGQGAPSDGSIYPHLIYLVSDDDPHEVARLCSVLADHPSQVGDPVYRLAREGETYEF